MEFLKKLKIELPYDPVTPLLGTYPQEPKSVYNRDTYITNAHHSQTITIVIHNSQTMETTQVP
jgi:hypothetical protein